MATLAHHLKGSSFKHFNDLEINHRYLINDIIVTINNFNTKVGRYTLTDFDGSVFYIDVSNKRYISVLTDDFLEQFSKREEEVYLIFKGRKDLPNGKYYYEIDFE